MLFSRIVDTSTAVAATSRRLEKTALLAALLRQLDPEEVEIVVAFLSGYTRQGRIGIGYATVRAAAAPAAGAATLEVHELDRALGELAAVGGSGSEGRRRELLHGLLARATEPEQRFLSGVLLGEIRQGALEGVMLDAVAEASGIDASRVRRAVMMAGDIARVARSALESGAAGLDAYGIQLFRPVQPMLAATSEDIEEALGELGEAALEFKLDGARVQVHRSGDEVQAFTRALNNVTAAVPEVVEVVRALPGRDLILDGEVISLTSDGRPQPFQVTARRFGRKLDLDRMRTELPLSAFWFDLLYLDGQPLLDEPQSRRFAELSELAPDGGIVRHLRTADPARAAGFFERALAEGHEGIVAKSPGAAYAAGARGQSWLKVKKPRTLDLVILAAEWGSGRRKGWLSNLHLGARDTEKGGFAMLGKTFKGLTDEMLAWQTKQFLEAEIGRDDYTVYVAPKFVAEIAFNEIQASTRYASGLALRFARVKRYRPDKSPAEADTLEMVRRLALSDGSGA
jgi:DNA ligase-1